MRKGIKTTIKYATGILLLLIVVLMGGVCYLYFSADMLTPAYTPTASAEKVLRTDSLRQYGDNYLRHSQSGLWELKIKGNAFQRGEAIGKLSPDLLYYQEKVFVDQIREIIPSESYLKFLRFFIVLFNRELGKTLRRNFGMKSMESRFRAHTSMTLSALLTNAS